MAGYTVYRSDIRGQMLCFESGRMEGKQGARARSLIGQATVLAAEPTLHSKIRYYRYTRDYTFSNIIDIYLSKNFERRPASGDEMLWQQLIGKDYASRDELARELGLALREQRLKAGLTQADLAERINMDEVSVRRWELGLRLPSIETLLLLEAVFIKDD